MTENHFYIISTKKKAKKNKYKLGRFSGTKKKLISRYRTYFSNNLVVYHFVEYEESVLLEKMVLDKLTDYREINDNGNLSEWVVLPLNDIIDVVDECIKSIDKEITAKAKKVAKKTNKINTKTTKLVALVPFGHEGINRLTIEDKIEIFFNYNNPVIGILKKTNLNPEFPQYHNIKMKEKQIYDGKKWTETNDDGMALSMVACKHKDLVDIYNEIEEYLTDDARAYAKKKISDIQTLAKLILD